MIAKRDLLAMLVPRPVRFFDLVNASARFAAVRRKFATVPRFELRLEMHALAHSQLAPGPVQYLEFGVWQGESLRYWTRLNSHPESRFFGFDTFEGLPEDWVAGHPRGTFDVGGDFPAIDDARARFIKGLFQDTLETFLATFQRGPQLVLHVDCDLYSSTLYVLATLDRVLQPGDLIIFDDFHSLTHEFAAFQDYERAFYRRWRPVAAFGPCTSVAMCVEGRALDGTAAA
jgi:hypothetical protein